MMGNITAAKVSISNIPQSSIYDASYAAYVNDKLARIAVINMREYNYTTNRSAPSIRPSSSYSFSLPVRYASQAIVQRLIANGSNAISGLTFDGYSYSYEINNGKPVLL